MPVLLVVGVLVAGVVALTPVADRIRVPYPVLLTLFGLAVPLVPGVPDLRIEPDLILPLVLPPLLFAATQRATGRDFKDNAGTIGWLAVGLTLASAVAAAAVAHAMGLPWAPAAALGAIVAPPDPVAATAVARRLRLPGRLVTVLEGEGMFNDATALVLYNVAVAAVVAGHVTAGDLGLGLVLALAVGVGLGLLAGVLGHWALHGLHSAPAETTVTIALPFAVYVLADRLEGSGVLAVLTLGLYLRGRSHSALTSGGWLLGRAVWRYADYLITSLVFVFIGFELTEVLSNHDDRGAALAMAGWVCLTLVAVRFGWVLVVTWLVPRGRGDRPASGREAVVTSWAGMRGVVTVATALALPVAVDGGGAFPDRGTIVVVALVTVLVTLVLQGLTLAPLVTRLRVGTEVDPAQEVRELRERATLAVLESLDDIGAGAPERVRDAVRLEYQGYLSAQLALTTARYGGDADDDEGDREAVEDLLRAAGEVERRVVVDARSSGAISPEAADEVLDEVERRAVRELD
ncbi:cation:proton antiporter [Cellulomonas sp. DKR-3]|uniref:Cation:proton antiporter n=1 Tax=Cellulomonas fulva TaxID=2835530 RepID=A0ABS5TVL4_9CELL|nr:cation:proton antiporter [Cellulomonas fulva]MBT0993162.1 cation:proton antiporter [Cellulomonas fulva]